MFATLLVWHTSANDEFWSMCCTNAMLTVYMLWSVQLFTSHFFFSTITETEEVEQEVEEAAEEGTYPHTETRLICKESL